MSKIERYKEWLAEDERTLKDYIKARNVIATGQSYTIGSRTLTRADLRYVNETIDALKKEILEYEGLLGTGAPRRAVAVVPQDY